MKLMFLLLLNNQLGLERRLEKVLFLLLNNFLILIISLLKNIHHKDGMMNLKDLEEDLESQLVIGEESI